VGGSTLLMFPEGVFSLFIYLFFVSYPAPSASQRAMTQSIRLSIDKNTNNSSSNNNSSGREK
jgi:hypothetical protein